MRPPFSGSRRHEKSGVLQQPVLQVRAVNEMDASELAAGNHLARLLHERVAAVVEGDGVHDAGFLGRLVQLPGVRRRHRERLVRNDVLAVLQRGQHHGHMQVIRRRVVDDVDVGIGDQRLVAAVVLGHAERIAFRRADARSMRDGTTDEAQPADGVDVVSADEAGPPGPSQCVTPAPAHGAAALHLSTDCRGLRIRIRWARTASVPF
jgi:hypothetical protein